MELKEIIKQVEQKEKQITKKKNLLVDFYRAIALNYIDDAFNYLSEISDNNNYLFFSECNELFDLQFKTIDYKYKRTLSTLIDLLHYQCRSNWEWSDSDLEYYCRNNLDNETYEKVIQELDIKFNDNGEVIDNE